MGQEMKAVWLFGVSSWGPTWPEDSAGMKGSVTVHGMWIVAISRFLFFSSQLRKQQQIYKHWVWVYWDIQTHSCCLAHVTFSVWPLALDMFPISATEACNRGGGLYYRKSQCGTGYWCAGQEIPGSSSTSATCIQTPGGPWQAAVFQLETLSHMTNRN